MKTLTEMSERHEAIKKRLEDILEELRESDDPQAKAYELAEEIALLLREATILNVNIQRNENIANFLLNQDCSGPH